MANVFIDDLKRTFSGSGKMIPRLILINVAMFLVFTLVDAFQSFGDTPLLNRVWVYFSVRAGFLETLVQPWSYISYMFLHVSFGHILGNMILLFFLGRILEQYMGARKVAAIYVLGGLAGALLFQFSYFFLHLAFPTSPLFMPEVPLLGASAGVLAVVVAVGVKLPNQYVNLFLFGPVKLKWVVLVVFVYTSLLELYANTGGKLAHIGGALLGYYFIRKDSIGVDIGKPVYWVMNQFARFGIGRGSGMRTVHRNTTKPPRSDYEYNKQKNWDQRKTDEILDKISKSGYDSLTKEEKEYLFQISKKR